MEKAFLKDEYKDGLEDELSDLSLMRDYLERTSQTEERFISLRQIEDLTFENGGIKIEDLLTMEKVDGKIDILAKRSKKHSSEEIAELMQKTGLEKGDIIALMQDGMQIEEISEKAENVPFKEISESAVIREMIRKDVKPEELAILEEKGIEVVPLEDGSLEVKSLEKLAEVNEKGMVQLEENLEKSLEPFEQIGLITISKGLAIEEVTPEQEIETQEMGKGQKGKLKIVPLQKKREEQTKEEIEKEEIAKQLGEKPEDIISVIRIEDREGGSKLFNDSLTQNAKPLIIRLRNNNFKVMEEKDDGTREELQGFEATPVSKQVASLLKDTAHNHDTYIKPGEIKAGKTNPNEEKYNIFQIRKAGESQDNDSNQLLFVGFSGKTDLNLIENRTNGSVAFAKVPQKSIYPRSIYLENNIGTPGKKEVEQGIGDTPKDDIPQASTIGYNDIEEKIATLEELKHVENMIREIEGQTGHDERCASQHGSATNHVHTLNENAPKQISNKEERDPEISDMLADNSRKLPDLYSRRGELLMKLGISLSDSVEKLEEEYELGPGRRPRH